MTEQDRVTVHEPRGPVNNGGGHQYNNYFLADRMIRKGVGSFRITREDRIRLADRFVPPGGYRVAAAGLEKPGATVLLKGLPGSGRRAAAIMLLHGFGESDAEERVRVEELLDTAESEDPVEPGTGDRFLVDLSGITHEDGYGKAQCRLAVLRPRVQEAGARMVVVLPWGMERAHPPHLEPHTVMLERPRGLAVLTRYLRMESMPFRPADLRSTALRQLVDRSPMRELARLAGLVQAARDSSRFGADFGEWLDQATHALTDRTDDVYRKMGTVRTAPARALMLATAMFEESHADIVYQAWHSLMNTVGHEEEAATELARMDFGQQLVDLGVERDREGRLHFGQLAYAETVRTYFWANFPGVRDDLGKWIGVTARLRGLTPENQANVVVRFGEQALAVGRPDDLFHLVKHWADAPTGGPGIPLAVAALELGLSHEEFGGWFRRQMYHLATSASLPDGLAHVLTAACVRSLSETHPDQAVVRLRHLAVGKGGAAGEARDALLELAGSDHRLYRSLVDRLHVWGRREPHAAEPHIRLLAELLHSERTPLPPPWPELYRGWEAVFSQPPTELWGSLVSSWLDTVAGDSTRKTALEAMARAAHGRAPALHRLYTIACDWAASARAPRPPPSSGSTSTTCSTAVRSMQAPGHASGKRHDETQFSPFAVRRALRPRAGRARKPPALVGVAVGLPVHGYGLGLLAARDDGPRQRPCAGRPVRAGGTGAPGGACAAVPGGAGHRRGPAERGGRLRLPLLRHRVVEARSRPRRAVRRRPAGPRPRLDRQPSPGRRPT
ncbi:hypothetical protein [Streptomyces sp. enrichment culture]|uniref:hypothetical protein n=1 Tax=Streptomyces sp. enrichment culture TaxID=1795815 RepID=UPI003F5650D7